VESFRRNRLPTPSGRARRLTFEPLENRALLATLPAGFAEAAIAVGLSNATAMEISPGGDLWVLEQGGAVKRFRPGSTTADVVGRLGGLGMNSSGERGLLGIAFDPQYATSKQVFLYYTSTAGGTHNRISRFTVNDADAADFYFAGASATGADQGSTGTPSETIIFDLDPLSGATNHNGGAIHFGPDSMLYVAVGENANPSLAQSLDTVHGKILRMTPAGAAPGDNPFLSATSGKYQTIWALGLRNPFTFAFQPLTGRMFINDVGQNTWEEINEGVAGANFGWPSSEGNAGTPPSGPGTYRAPVYAYSHGGGTFQGEAITGGAFYNPAVPHFPAEFTGDYFFADYINSWINVLDVGSGVVTRFASNADNPVDLRVASDGSLYYLSRGLGQVFRVHSLFAPDPFPWHNAQNQPDVDANGSVTANDALIVINLINANGAGPLPPPSTGNSPPPYVDVLPDNFLAPIDALYVINFINAGLAAGEGETAVHSLRAWTDSFTLFDPLVPAGHAKKRLG
jgi:glucose/arabinose dehydrogenase